MIYHSKKLKEIMDKIKKGSATDVEKRMYKNLTRLSGMKGAEKKTKDKIGKSLNIIDRNDVVDKAMKRISSISGESNDS